MASYKERKTQFVTDLVGGTTLDIYIVTSISAFSYLVWCVLKRRSRLFDGTRTNESMITMVVDFLLNWNNLLFATTIYSNKIFLLIQLNLMPLVAMLLFSEKKAKVKSNLRRIIINLNNVTARQFLPFKTYITVYRAQMMIITCICIMAVDFNIFPRRFGKVETWGTSMMDLGVGSFVFSMGLISARSYLRQLLDNKFNYFKTIKRSFQNSIPIFGLGLIRLLSVKSVDYHEHVTEYGKHWNFFFTLACLPILNSIFSPLILKISPVVTSFLISIIYEFVLVQKGGLEYIISSPRNSLIDANREGILSLFGYFPIFLNGLSLGVAILPVISIPGSMFKLGMSREELHKRYKNGKRGVDPLVIMLSLAVIYQLSYYIIDTCYVYSVSRRMANLLYVIWVSAYNCTFLFCYGFIEKFILGDVEISVITEEDSEIETNIDDLVDDSYVPTSLTAVNLNSLVIFLVSNLLTGLINLTMNTIDSDNKTSMLVLFLYELALSCFSLILYKNGIILR